MGYPKYNDGLDDDGYPLVESYRKPYIHGSEADADETEPVLLGSALANVVKRVGVTQSIGDNAESPIELQLGAAVLMLFEKAGKPLKLCLSLDTETAPVGLLLVPQFKWSHYRSDWAIYNPKSQGALLLECDGAAFHSSEDQVAHDARKDAAAHDRGFLTMRFSGSDIHRFADHCAKKVFQTVYGGGK